MLQRRALLDAAKIAQLPRPQLIHETSAAALHRALDVSLGGAGGPATNASAAIEPNRQRTSVELSVVMRSNVLFFNMGSRHVEVSSFLFSSYSVFGGLCGAVPRGRTQFTEGERAEATYQSKDTVSMQAEISAWNESAQAGCRVWGKLQLGRTSSNGLRQFPSQYAKALCALGQLDFTSFLTSPAYSTRSQG